MFVFFSPGDEGPSAPSIDEVEGFLTEQERDRHREAEEMIQRQAEREQGITHLETLLAEQQIEKQQAEEDLAEATENADAAQERFDKAQQARDAAQAQLDQLQADRQQAEKDLERAERRFERAIERKLRLLERAGRGGGRFALQQQISRAERDARRADGAAARARERIESLNGQIPEAEQQLHETEAAWDEAAQEHAAAQQELREAESAAAIACTRLEELVGVRDRMVQQAADAEKEIAAAIDDVAQAITRGKQRQAEFARLDEEITKLERAKEALSEQRDAILGLMDWLTQDVGSEIPPEVQQAIDDEQHQQALENAAEVFDALYDLVDSLRKGPGIGTVWEVVKIGGSMLTELAGLLYGAKTTGLTFGYLETYLKTGEPPKLATGDGAAIRDYILANHSALSQITGSTPPGGDASVGQHLAWLQQNALAAAIGLARAGKHPGEPVEWDNILNNAAISYLNRQGAKLQVAIESVCAQIEKLQREQRALKQS